MILIQLFLPTTDNDGHAFPQTIFTDVRDIFTKKFGGVTSFSQSPAEGVWDAGDEIQKDRIVIFEVMAEDIDKKWWSAYQKELERQLNQDKILIRWFDVNTLN